MFKHTFKKRTLLLGGTGYGPGGNQPPGTGKGPCKTPCGHSSGTSAPYCKGCKGWATPGGGTGTPGGPAPVPGCETCQDMANWNAANGAQGGPTGNYCKGHQYNPNGVPWVNHPGGNYPR